MEKNITWKWIALAGMMLWSIILVSGGVKKGLDIQGGAAFEVQIDADELKKQMLSEPDSEYGSNPAKLEADAAKRIKESREVVVERIRNRIDGMGVEEPSIYPRGDDRIVIQLPGIDTNKMADARKSLEEVGFLSFRLVHEQSQFWTKDLFDRNLAPPGFKATGSGEDRFFVRDTKAVPDEKAGRDFWNGIRNFARRAGCELLLQKDLVNGATVYRPFYVETRMQMDGRAVERAQVDIGQMGDHRITLKFNAKGMKQFARVTSDYAPNGERNAGKDGRQLGIVLDSTLYSAPVIRSPILAGNAEITGRFTFNEASRLVNVLRAGSLPVPVKVLSQNEVSATMGESAVKSGVLAAIVGLVGVVLFMASYYRLAGMIQNGALVLISLLLPFGAWVSAGILGILAGSGEGGTVKLPVITMPGIAGLALTLGMAVDAAVLIFERMREETAAGKTLRAAIDAGYDRAFSAIFDSNVTLVITSIILFWQGTGPVRGFAVMLNAGIITSMIIYLIYMRIFLETVAERGHVKSFKMMHILHNTNFDFVSKTMMAIIVTIVLLVGSWFVVFQKGKKAFNVEFTGGAALTFTGLDPSRLHVNEIEEALKKAGIAEPFVQYEGRSLQVRVASEQGDLARETLMKAYQAQGLAAGMVENIGPQVGKELKRSGITAFCLAMLGILIYLTVRFQLAFACGAVFALVHDALITIGLYAALGHQYSLPFISALLAMSGYSTNETIIVFDRVREEIKLHGSRMSMRDVCNRAINLTLSRTVITHSVTLISVTALLVLGTGVVKDIALTMFIGIITGVFSSIFIATPVMLFFHRRFHPEARESQKRVVPASAAAKAKA